MKKETLLPLLPTCFSRDCLVTRCVPAHASVAATLLSVCLKLSRTQAALGYIYIFFGPTSLLEMKVILGQLRENCLYHNNTSSSPCFLCLSVTNNRPFSATDSQLAPPLLGWVLPPHASSPLAFAFAPPRL